MIRVFVGEIQTDQHSRFMIVVLTYLVIPDPPYHS